MTGLADINEFEEAVSEDENEEASESEEEKKQS